MGNMRQEQHQQQQKEPENNQVALRLNVYSPLNFFFWNVNKYTHVYLLRVERIVKQALLTHSLRYSRYNEIVINLIKNLHFRQRE